MPITLSYIQTNYGGGSLAAAAVNAIPGTTLSGTDLIPDRSMLDFLSIPITFPSEYNGQSYTDTASPPDNYGSFAELNYWPDGTFTIDLQTFPGGSAGNWRLPNVSGIGANYWARATRTFNFFTGSSGATYYISPSTGWINLYQPPGQKTTLCYALMSGSPFYWGVAEGAWTIELATDSAGANIVNTQSIALEAIVPKL